MRTARTYARVTEAEKMIKALCEKYPDLFWAVRPEQIAVMGVDNQERSEKAVEKNPNYAKLRVVKGSEKALFIDSHIPIRHVIELYFSDWQAWKDAYRQWVLANCIVQISAEDEKKHAPDCTGFKVLLDVSGVTWDDERFTDNLPNLLHSDVKFNLDLRPGLEATEDGENQPPDGKQPEVEDDAGTEDITADDNSDEENQEDNGKCATDDIEEQ